MSGNSRQRRTVARAKDARRPYGAAVERERRKAKQINRCRPRNWPGNPAKFFSEIVPIGWDQAKFIEEFRRAFWAAANPLRYPEGLTWSECAGKWAKSINETRDGEATIID